MKQIYTALYDLLCYITEDAVANKLNLNGFPQSLMDAMNNLAVELGNYLDTFE